jgi:hypothetical protein
MKFQHLMFDLHGDLNRHHPSQPQRRFPSHAPRGTRSANGIHLYNADRLLHPPCKPPAQHSHVRAHSDHPKAIAFGYKFNLLASIQPQRCAHDER